MVKDIDEWRFLKEVTCGNGLVFNAFGIKSTSMVRGVIISHTIIRFFISYTQQSYLIQYLGVNNHISYIVNSTVTSHTKV